MSDSSSDAAGLLYDSFEYAQKVLRLGASDILSKPIDMEQLKQAVIRAVGWKFTGNDTSSLYETKEAIS